MKRYCAYLCLLESTERQDEFETMKLMSLLQRVLLPLFLLLHLALSVYTQLDRNLLEKGGVLWSGILPINAGTTISDQDLANLAREAYQEMASDYKAKRDDKTLPSRFKPGDRPSVLAALVNPDGSRIFFSTNVKGLLSVLVALTPLGGPDQKIIQALNRCQLSVEEITVESSRDDIKHVNKAACAEILLAHEYFVYTQNGEIGQSRILAVERRGPDTPVQVTLKPFCDIIPGQPARGTYGCLGVMNELGVTGVNIEPNGDPLRPEISLGQMIQQTLC
ncbi:hypothetical protein BU16DRAFT_538391 [Lophium mytilinum]|uniref:Uncharacterized protein n=1 Tax=Lophium mytilinum TaxID=390894 RepID=A0A6A6QUD5_9PEZI|nr:hypothetical protein BU16DRAFT_538391 [Lophium mytilinum]